MPTTAQTGRRAGRVINILRSINESAGASGSLVRSSLHLIQIEAFDWKEGKTPEEIKAIEDKGDAQRSKSASQKADRAQKAKDKRASATEGKPKKKPALFKTKEGYEDDKLADDREKIGFDPDEREVLKGKDQERRAGKEKKEKKPSFFSKKKDAADGSDTPRPGDSRPPAPPEAPAQAAAGDEPTDARSEKDVKEKLKGFRKSRAKTRDQAFQDKRGRRIGGAAGLQRMAKLRDSGGLPAKTGGVEVSQGASIHDKVDALQSMIHDLTQHVRSQGRESIRSTNTTPGARRDTGLHPEDELGGLSRQDFARHQASRRADLDWQEKERQRRGKGRSLGARGGPERDYHGYAGHDRQSDFEPAALRSKVSKLRRERMKHPAERDREHDTAKGHFIRKRADDADGNPRETGERQPEHNKWAGHYTDPDTGDAVHSSGKKDNKKFANATTFGASDDDAMLHTDKDKSGSRGNADDSEFAKVGDTSSDPRKKWYRVSKEGGYASAMASLGKSYRKGGDTKEKVVDKVRGAGFVDRKGHQIDVRPTGDLHTNRSCEGAKGDALKARDPKEHYRLCKGSHDGEGGTKKGRSEYGQGFNPQHDDGSKKKGTLQRVHQAAEKGKKWPSGR